jgi:hypothetical protein
MTSLLVVPQPALLREALSWAQSHHGSALHYPSPRLRRYKPMDFPLYEDAILVIDLPDDGLVAGSIGTVIARHDVPGLEPGYSLEFCDHLGKTIAVVTVPASALRRPDLGNPSPAGKR